MSKKTAIVFPGQGSQIMGMGFDLAQNFSVAKHLFAEIDEQLKFKLSTLMFEGPSEELTKTQYAQPALMAVSMAIVKVLLNETKLPFSSFANLTAGHSLGEYSALCASGVFDVKTTAYLLQIRGSAMAKCGEKTQGAMAAVLGGEPEQIAELAKKASSFGVCQVANDNAVGQVVISGEKKAIDYAMLIAKEFGVKRAILLQVSGAFHSELMLDAKQEMKQALQNINYNQPQSPVVANITALPIVSVAEIPNLLTSQITGSVLWRQTNLYFAQQQIERIIEIGSGKVLCGLANKTCPQIETLSLQNSQDIANFLASL